MAPKIIISKIGLCCESFYDKKGEYASINTNCLHSFKDGFFPEFILCWLNSKLYNYLFECLFDGLRMSGGYLLYSAPNLLNTYIQQATIGEQEPFILLSDRMLALNADLQKTRARFLKRLGEHFDGLKTTGALETFDELEFGAFIKELAKQKLTLSLKMQDEWEEYFNEYRIDCRNLARHITETDSEINKLVYELYNLSDEEIKIVENTTTG
jgi:hypothetical protein